MDRISNLPDLAIETVLKCLPLRDAVRTSVLSRAWRDQWCTVPQLIFDLESFPHSRQETKENYESRLSRIVDKVVLLHQGPIHKFKLSIAQTSRHDINRWIYFLSRYGIEEFILHILHWGEDYRLPFYFFSFKELTYLELRQCMFDPPSCFIGFSRLTVLDLTDVTFTDDDGFGLLLSLCPLLKKLLLNDMYGCTSLRINSPTLVELSVDGAYIPLNLERAPLLATASIKYPKYVQDLEWRDKMRHNMVDVFGYLPSIERLMLHDFTLRSFAYGDIPDTLPVLLPLNHLSIYIDFGSRCELLAAFCILRSSLMLEKLDITALYFEPGSALYNYFGQDQGFNSSFNHLQTLKITKFVGTINELRFVELIVANAPILERLQVVQANEDDLEMFRERVRLARRSTTAEIIVTA